jgi:hypothetical protein
MARSDPEYDIISPYTLPAQTGNNNNDIPESTLTSRIHTVAFNDDDGSCVFITNTPIDDGELDPYEDSDSDFGSPSSLPRIRFIDHVRAKAAGVPLTVPGSPGSHRPDGFDWSHPWRYESYEEDPISSANSSVASSPELSAISDVREGRSATTSTTTLTARTFDSLLSNDSRPSRDASPLPLPRPFAVPNFLAMEPATYPALYREMAVGESAFSRGVSGERREPRVAQEAPDPDYAAFLERSIERLRIEPQQRSTPDQITIRIGMRFLTIPSPRNLAVSVGDDAARSATRRPAIYSPIDGSLWGYMPRPPSFYGIPPPPPGFELASQSRDAAWRMGGFEYY